jgi:hypothetical protein
VREEEKNCNIYPYYFADLYIGIFSNFLYQVTGGHQHKSVGYLAEKLSPG